MKAHGAQKGIQTLQRLMTHQKNALGPMLLAAFAASDYLSRKGICFTMSSPAAPFRHITSPRNPALIESWCLICGMFVAASITMRNLRVAENSHSCTAGMLEVK